MKKFLGFYLSLVLIASILIYIDYFNMPTSYAVQNAAPSKKVHISFDDVSLCLQDLANNKAIYSSIFDNQFLADLRNLHSQTGACFTLYVYEIDGKFHLSDMPKKWKQEWLANSSWLRFGYHSQSPQFTKLSDTAFVSSFRRTQYAICQFSDSSNLASTLRLHYFWATRPITDSLLCHGITGLLGPDDDRLAYSLDSTQSHFLRENGYIETHNMKYFRTDLRLDKCKNPMPAISRLEDRDTVVIFTHEWAYTAPEGLRSKINMIRQGFIPISDYHYFCLKQILRRLHKLGYEFSFLD